jgi:hypothetical protein
MPTGAPRTTILPTAGDDSPIVLRAEDRASVRQQVLTMLTDPRLTGA